MKKFLLLIFLVFFSLQKGYCQKMITVTYFQNDTLQLDLDVFLPEKTTTKKLPLLLYVHGGGFAGGERQSGHSLCRYLAQNGYATATISYTLYMKSKNFSCGGILSEKLKAIQLAVNDLWLATDFFLKNSGKYNIDPEKIFISGSSAGGETALHAAFWDRKVMQLYDNQLPGNFNYAGLVSGAGAIMDLNLITKNNLLPMFLFHGSGDKTVPYGTAAHHYCKTNASGWLMLFGSHSVFNHANELDGTTELHTFCGGDHGYSGFLFEKEQHYLLSFLNNVLDGRKFQNHIIIPTGQQNERSAVYGFCD